MDLFENPFFILGVGPRSTREEIMEASDAAGLSGDPDAAAEAAAALANPRKRLAAEVFFLPGLGKAAADDLISQLTGPVARMPYFAGVSPAAAVNLTAAALKRLAADGPGETAYGIGLLSQAFERTDPGGLAAAVNSDRQAAGLPPVRSVADVGEELEKLRLHCRATVRAALDRLSPECLVEAAAQAAREGTDDGRRPPTVIVRDMAEIYGLESGAFFEREEATVRALVKALRSAASGMSQGWKAPAVADDLETVLMNWKAVAAPLLTVARSTGVTHRPGFSLACDVRNAAVEIHNSGGDPALSRKLNSIVAKAFGDIPEIREATARDARTLAG